ncbi:MAG: helix-turn-helix transcriptional regulator [Polyangiaceae bacterium]|jgi:transcriptional regulator with XRE-family HTH domain
MPIPIAGQSLAVVLLRTQHVLAGSQQKLGDIVGVNRRTVWRWQSGKITPSPDTLQKFARLTYPKDPEVAAALAAACGQTLESLGLVPPPPPPAPPLPPPGPPPEEDPVKTRLFVDAIVCAAAEALDASPRAVRGALFAAFTRAREAGLPVETVEKALAPPPKPRPKAT